MGSRCNVPVFMMQAKISAYFKPSLGNDTEAAAIFTENDVPYSKQEISVTYKCRVLNSNQNSEDDIDFESDDNGIRKQANCIDYESKDQDISCADESRPKASSKNIMLNKKRSYAQYHLELGQTDFLIHTCSICGLKYSRGDEEDEEVHKKFHSSYYHGIQFKGWQNERVVFGNSVARDRIILVLNGDSPTHRHKVAEAVKLIELELGLNDGCLLHSTCKTFLFISKHRIIGCLVAEPIRTAHRVIPTSMDRDNADLKIKAKLHRAKLQFGSVTFVRESTTKVPSSSVKTTDMNERGAIICEEETVPACCGVRAIWVAPSSRRKQVATQLLDVMRKNFSKGRVLETSHCAFSQPNSSGRALASSYCGTRSFLVYLTAGT